MFRHGRGAEPAAKVRLSFGVETWPLSSLDGPSRLETVLDMMSEGGPERLGESIDRRGLHLPHA